MKPNELVSAQFLADLTGYSESKVYRLAKVGVIKRRGSRTKESGFPLAETMQALLAAAESGEDKAPEPKEPTVDEQIKAQKLARLQREDALERRQIAPVNVLQEYAERVALQVRSALEALPGAVQKRIPHLRASEVNMIRSEVTKIGDRIANFDDRSAA